MRYETKLICSEYAIEKIKNFFNKYPLNRTILDIPINNLSSNIKTWFDFVNKEYFEILLSLFKEVKN